MAEQQRPPYRDYKAVLRSSLAEVMVQRGLSPSFDDGEAFLSCLSDTPPHPDVPDALERLREKFRLAIISNSDDDLIAATVASIGVPVDFVVTSQQAHDYKPDHRQAATAGNLTAGLSVTRARLSRLMYLRATAYSSLVCGSDVGSDSYSV
jgi:hypothetical protein